MANHTSALPCSKVLKTERAVACDQCGLWNHIDCQHDISRRKFAQTKRCGNIIRWICRSCIPFPEQQSEPLPEPELQVTNQVSSRV